MLAFIGKCVKYSYSGHERVKDTDSKSRSTSKRLSEIQFSVRIIVIVLVQELNIAVVHKFGDHWHIGSIHGAFSEMLKVQKG